MTNWHLHDSWYYCTPQWVKRPCRDDIIHWSFIISSIAAALLLSSVATLQSKARRIDRGVGGGAHISLKWRPASNRASLFSSLFARVPFHCPGMQSCWNVGTRVWYGGWVWGGRLGRLEAKMWSCDGTAEPGQRMRISVLPAKHMWAWHWTLGPGLARGGPVRVGLLQLLLWTLHIRPCSSAGQGREQWRGGGRGREETRQRKSEKKRGGGWWVIKRGKLQAMILPVWGEWSSDWARGGWKTTTGTKP